MRPSFSYLRPRSAADAVEMKSRYGARARFWAGGTDMMLLWQQGKARFDHCIDLTFVDDIKAIVPGEREIRIGAMATLDVLDRQASGNPMLQMLAEVARLMCTPQTRTIATIGGNLCHAAPSADLPPLLVAMEARTRILGPEGKRELPVEDFFRGVNETALEDDEMLIAVTVPIPAKRRQASYKRVARTVVDIALVSSAVALTVDGGDISEARVVLGAVAPVPIRSRAAEAMLRGTRLAALEGRILKEVGRLASADSTPISDIRASAAYRREMCDVLTRRAVEDCIGKLVGRSV